MTGAVHTFTVVHIGVEGPEEHPYAVVVVDVDGRLRTGRADGDLAWLSVGAGAALARGPSGMLTATAS